MSVLEIPVQPLAADMRQSCSLDGSVYVIDLSWSARSESWFISLAQQTSVATPTPVITGLRLTVNWPVLLGVTGAFRPPGEIIAVDMTGQGRDAGREDLGSRVRIYYYDAAELNRA